MRRILLAGAESDALRRLMVERRFVRRALRRFVPGERLEDALAAASALREAGILAVLTRLGENVTDPADASATADHYLEALREISRGGAGVQISVKLTQLGLDVERPLAAEHLRRLAARASELGSLVWVDMEQSRYVDATLELVGTARSSAPAVGVCLQAYLHRTPEDLRRMLALGVPVRLVKGAYREPAGLALQGRPAVDARYLELADRLLTSCAGDGVAHAFATHDDRLVAEIRGRAARLGVSAGSFEIQMLYGIRPGLQRELAREGARMRVLVSYGSAWYAWYMRRLAEKPSNVLLLVRSLIGGGG